MPRADKAAATCNQISCHSTELDLAALESHRGIRAIIVLAFTATMAIEFILSMVIGRVLACTNIKMMSSIKWLMLKWGWRSDQLLDSKF